MTNPAFANRSYVIIPSGSIPWVDFDDVMETSAETLRFSVDGTQTFVKFNGDAPGSVNAIPGRSAPYTWEQIINILSGVEWSPTGDLV